MKKGKITILASVIAVMLVSVAIGAGTLAFYSDTETSADNVFGGLTMNLLVDKNSDNHFRAWGDDPLGSLNDAYLTHPYFKVEPGWQTGTGKQALKVAIANEGEIDGTASITFTNIINLENGYAEPEPHDGKPAGELGGAMKVKITYITYIDDLVQSETTVREWKSIDDIDGIPYYAPDSLLATASIPRVGPDDTHTPTNWAQWQLEFWVPGSVGNEIMTDTLEFDMIFGLTQEPT